MLLLVLDLKALSIPAAGKHELQTETIKTVGVEVSLIWHEVAIEGAFRSNRVVKAVETQCGLLKKGLGVIWSNVPVRLWNVGDRISEVTLIGITSNHLEVFGKGGQASVASIWIQKIVPLYTVSKGFVKRKLDKSQTISFERHDVPFTKSEPLPSHISKWQDHFWL